MRDIAIFLVLAEELHFGRAAARLHVSQARVSQAIAEQERRLGGTLFDRSNRRNIQLTPLGRQLHGELGPAYAALCDSIERARLAARGITAVLRVGMLPMNVHDLRPYWATFRARHPTWELRFSHPPFHDVFGCLRRDEIDVLVAWLPVEEPDLTVGPVLFSEPRVLAVAAGHELARRTSVSLEVVSDFRHADTEIGPAYWFEGYVPSRTRSGRRIERGPLVRNPNEALTLTGLGEVVTIFPAHMARYGVRPDIAYLAVQDMSPLAYALVWRTAAENAPIRALTRTVRDLGPLETGG
ncbi:LysR family transcriptional regulator [Nonomuraea rubra]|uniref:DNA-binding transcriptional LysR family regulator n=1 Tax=Nonomuraea rubra TaxID=46180 RepID=A0A7X0P243_9ACTN|nr:LysR family transcriptional regulator [Nonomuraea rubra]MBB6553641.1 DNA-binding transcriptional LysR family regulator [Nonomuraea rubra]